MRLISGVDCSLTNTVQGVDAIAYPAICGHDGSEADADLVRGDQVTAERRQEVAYLNQALGTDYDLSSIIMTHCAGVDDGICVLTPDAGGATYTLDRYSPVSGRTEFVLSNSCISSFGRFVNMSDPLMGDDEACGYIYEGETPAVPTAYIGEIQENIDNMRFAFDYPNIYGAFVTIALVLDEWFGTDILSRFQIMVAADDTTARPEAVFGGDTDGATAVEPEPVPQEAVPVARAEQHTTTKYPLEIFRTGGDGNTASRY